MPVTVGTVAVNETLQKGCEDHHENAQQVVQPSEIVVAAALGIGASVVQPQEGSHAGRGTQPVH